MLEEREKYKPLVLFQHDGEPERYSLILSDSHMVTGTDVVFEENGRYGNGYGWADVALAAIRSHSPELESRFGIDPEAGMFAAYGTDLEALEALAVLLHKGYHDHEVLAEWVRSAPYEYD